MRWPGWLASWAAPGRSLSLLIFHRVLRQPDPLIPDEPDARRFEQLLRWLRGYAVLPLEEAVTRLHDGTLPAGALSITFDDGYADNHDVALPILQRHGMSAAFFVSSAFVDGGRMWSDTVVESVRRCRDAVLDVEDAGLGRHALDNLPARRQAMYALLARLKYMSPLDRAAGVQAVARAARVRLPDDLMLRSEQVRALHRAGMAIGSHTRTHPILASLGDEAAREEIVASKRDLEAMIDAPVTLFAYPNGRPRQDYQQRHCRFVQDAGYRAALTTANGAARPGADMFQLPRFTPWDRTPLRFGLRMAFNMRQPVEVAA